MVWQAYRKVRSNKGSAGVDNISLKQFDENLSKNLYKIWNRMASGSYLAQPVKEVIIPKSNGGKRQLGIPSIGDRIAQEVVKAYLEPRLEAVFLPQSYGYRPGRNAHQALEAVRKNVRNYAWVIDMDIKSFFDEVDHDLLLKALDKHVHEKWVKLYIKRWLETPVQTHEGLVHKQGKGTPQGGVISPLLANLFLHYVLDKWLEKTFPAIKFVRYADDVVVHCMSEQQSHYVLEGIRRRLKTCKLQLSEEKTKITYCMDYRRPRRRDYAVKFDFLGHTYKPMSKKSKRDSGVFLGYDCCMSMKSRKRIIHTWKQMNFQRESTWTLQDLAQLLNTQTRGLMNYFGKMETRSLVKVFIYLDYRIAKWVKNKFKKLRSYQKAFDWLREVRLNYPTLFAHWSISKF
ncbi:MAG: group II intron reverse transcriptase/maturase [Saprospiraceae bacterium]|nr:group II intron reverse transcriptase/maturase [Saprospiraceae bacterium]